jgi:hypothetical protein
VCAHRHVRIASSRSILLEGKCFITDDRTLDGTYTEYQPCQNLRKCSLHDNTQNNFKTHIDKHLHIISACQVKALNVILSMVSYVTLMECMQWINVILYRVLVEGVVMHQEGLYNIIILTMEHHLLWNWSKCRWVAGGSSHFTPPSPPPPLPPPPGSAPVHTYTHHYTHSVMYSCTACIYSTHTTHILYT